jgi:hypothetical protein
MREATKKLNTGRNCSGIVLDNKLRDENWDATANDGTVCLLD